MTPTIKAKITRYHTRIGKALAKGYQVIKAKNDGRIKEAHRAQGIKGLPGLRVVFVKPVGKGYRITINRDGSIRASNKTSGISRVTIGARFFDAEEVEKGEPEAEAARLIAIARKTLGHKPQRCAVAYWGGENAWSELWQLPELLVIHFTQYAESKGYPADGVTFYWVKRSKQIMKAQQRLRDERTAAAKRRAKKRNESDV